MKTLFNSLSLGMIISQYDLLLVSQAFFLTAIIVVSLTMYTLQSTKDFQWLGGMLYSALMVSALGGLLHVSQVRVLIFLNPNMPRPLFLRIEIFIQVLSFFELIGCMVGISTLIFAKYQKN